MKCVNFSPVNLLHLMKILETTAEKLKTWNHILVKDMEKFVTMDKILKIQSVAYTISLKLHPLIF